MQTAYLNGEFLPLLEAKVSVLDRGFLLGDGVYEVMPAYHKTLFRLPEHFQRLQNSLDAIGMKNPLTLQQCQHILQQLIDADSADNQSLYLQITRGVSKRDHAFPSQVHPTVFAMSNPIEAPPQTWLEQGIKAITLDDIRWQWCQIKSISLLANVLLRQQAVEQQQQEAILIREGQVTEGAASNVFIVEQGRILTPPKTDHLLPGITRDLILQLAQDNGLPATESPITPSQLQQADEIWVSSSTREVLAVTELNGEKIGTGAPGPVWHKIRALYQMLKN